MTLELPEKADLREPLGNFAFHVSFETEGTDVPAEPFGAFSEVSGLEATMEHKLIKEGGWNYGSAVRIGQVSFATVVLKRGIVEVDNLWDWWSLFTGASGEENAFPSSANRCDVLIGMLALEPPKPEAKLPLHPKPEIRAIWRLSNAIPVKFRAGDLSAKGGEIAIEELHLMHEGLNFERPAS